MNVVNVYKPQADFVAVHFVLFSFFLQGDILVRWITDGTIKSVAEAASDHRLCLLGAVGRLSRKFVSFFFPNPVGWKADRQSAFARIDPGTDRQYGGKLKFFGDKTAQ